MEGGDIEEPGQYQIFAGGSRDGQSRRILSRRGRGKVCVRVVGGFLGMDRGIRGLGLCPRGIGTE